MKVSFKCQTCGGGGNNEFRKAPSFQIAAYEDIIEWSEMEDNIPCLNENNWWHRSEKLPRIGEKRAVYVRYPFNESANKCFWTLYFPANSSINGWEEYPEEIDQSAFVKCKLNKIISSNESSAWIQVEVKDLIILSDAINRIPVLNETDPIINNIYQFENFEIKSFGDWLYCSGSAQGDLGNWLLLRLIDAEPRLIAFGEWTFHQYTAYISNISISASTFETLQEWRNNA